LSCYRYRHKVIGKDSSFSLRLQFLTNHRTREREYCLFPQACLFLKVGVSRDLNYISWDTAFCAHPRTLSGEDPPAQYDVLALQQRQKNPENSLAALSEIELMDLLGYRYPSLLSIPGSRPWTVELRPLIQIWICLFIMCF
jgi:hypothetical protein